MNRAEYTRMYDAEERQWWYVGMRRIASALLEGSVPSDPQRRVLDAGCGSGANLPALSRYGRAVGIDVSKDALTLARQRRASVAGASVMRLPFADGVFGLVTSFDVLYHRWVPDDALATGELARVLAPGGFLLVRMPALMLLWGAHDEAVHSRHRYRRAEVETLLRGAGLQVVRSTYANFFLFPLVLLRRRLDRLTGRHGSDVAFLPAPFEALFRGLLLAEAWLAQRISLPIGASVLVLARKP
ncbi:MAG TPA: class I SAM-dependent methyltransferase [Vicinamibacteria bacterium]|nr:class I SAM-dependent methyltransferase [Vicinamibacteria bacterium]